MAQHHWKVRSKRQLSERTEKTTTNIRNQCETAFSRSKSFEQIVELRFAIFDQFLVGSVQDLSHDPSKSLTGHWLKLCLTFSKFYVNQDDAFKESLAGICTLTGVSADAADSVTKRTAVYDLLSIFKFHNLAAIVGTPFLPLLTSG